MNRSDRDPTQLMAAAVGGDRRAIGRLLTLVEAGGSPADAVAELTHPLSGGAEIIGVTGPPGVGKSTLVSQLLVAIGRDGKQPAVLAVDPSSPLTGGAILGDRVRIDASDTGTFIRSIATRGHAGGLAEAVPGAVRVLDASTFDPIIIETVGVGQIEVEITAAADTTVVLANPGTGDAVQANKAGLLEVADIFVVNKSDHPGADDARRHIDFMLDLSHMTGQEDATGRRPPIIMVNSLDGSGISELWSEICAHRQHLLDTGQLADRRSRRSEAELRSRATHRLATLVDTELASVRGKSLLNELHQRTIAPSAAADALIEAILESRDH